MERRPATAEEAKALASPVRLRIVRELYDGPLTNKQVAERLAMDPATTLHHVRTLVRTGFVEPAEERTGRRGARERPYRTTGKSWTLDVSDVGGGHSVTSAMIEAFAQEVATVDPADVRASRLALRLSPAALDELTQRLEDLFDEYAALPPDPQGAPRALFFVVYPRENPSARTGAAWDDRRDEITPSGR